MITVALISYGTRALSVVKIHNYLFELDYNKCNQLTGGTFLGEGAISYTGDDMTGGLSYRGADTGMFIEPVGCWVICADPV